MKKYLIALLISLSCTLTLAAVGCVKDDPKTSESGSESGGEQVITDPVEVNFEEGEGYTFLSNAKDGMVQRGSTLTFSVEVGGFYTGNPLAYVDGTAIAPNADGTYSVTVNEEITISATGVQKDISNMVGTGAFEDPFQVSKPIDLLYIAEQVNRGNSTYATASYLLMNDIDCKGEELQVIGNNPDDPTTPAYFSGCFVSNYSEETGASYRYTISNFELNTQGTNYVGLFGAVYADLSVQSSGLFYGINLDNFTVNAGMYREDATSSSTSDTIACGALVGYGVGVNAMLCSATNGEIYVDADESYFSFVGGLIGYQQGYYFTEYGEVMPSEVSYSYTDVDVTITQGLGLYAGGISGYLATNYPFGAIATINNSYSTGNVSNALRSGGIAGGLGQYTSVSNCYATGDIAASSLQSNNDPLWAGSEYCMAHAGGIVGFAENDSIAHDCYFGGTLSAYTVSGGTSLRPGEEATDAIPNGTNGNNKFAFANAAIGGGYDAGYVFINSEKYIALDCLSGSDIDLSNANAFTEKLSWQEYNWVFEAKKYPVINYTYSSETPIQLKMNIYYVAPNAASGTEIKVNGNTSRTETYFDSSQQNPTYSPLGNFYATGSLPMAYKADNGYRSYGYFFDPECTQRVPYSYLPMKDVPFYIGFADATPLIGTYYFTTDSSTTALTLVFDEEGFLTYSDGVKTQRASYYFDGTNILVEGARLARYYEGAVIVDDTDTTVYADANFDLYRYMYYNYVGSLTENGLELYDGAYFTKDKPFTASSTAPTLETYDAFKGNWAPSATVNKLFKFDGKGNFTYTYTAYTRELSMTSYAYVATPTVLESASGTYTFASGDTHTVLFTMNGVNYSATLNANDGSLEIANLSNNSSYVCYREVGYLGSWTANGYTLKLEGIRADGTGLATFFYEDGTTYDLVYEESETAGYVCLYLPDEDYWKGDFFGYFSYDLGTNTLTLVLGDSEAEAGYSAQSMYLVDNYNGDWISNATEFLDMEFEFDGNGLYSFLGTQGVLLLTDGNHTTRLSYSLDSTQNGKFSYNGVEYTLTYDHITGSAKITQNTERELERKDEFANIEFVDLNGVSYIFNGKSNLDIGGKLTVGGSTEYVYKVASEGYDVYSGEEKVGSIVKASNHYDLTISGTTTDLYIRNEFMGDWAISGRYALFKIGPTDTNGVIDATFAGSRVELTHLDPTTLTFRYRDEIGMPINYYVFVMEDEYVNADVLIVLEYPYLLGEYIVCSRVNEMYGEWTANTVRKTSIRFDGVSSGYQNGIAMLKDELSGSSTSFYYIVRDDGILMWSQEPMGNDSSTWYYLLTFTDDLTDVNAFVLGNKAFTRKRVDGLCLTKATDTETKQTYIFDGGCHDGGTGYIHVDSLTGAKKYAYTYITYNSNNTATLEVTDVSTNKKYTATLDYTDSANVTFTLGEEIAE